MSQVEETPPPHQTDQQKPDEELTTRRPQFKNQPSRRSSPQRGQRRSRSPQRGQRRSRSPQRRNRMRGGYPSQQQPFGQYSQPQPGVYMSPMMLSPQQQTFLMQQQHMLQQQQGNATGRTQQQQQQMQPQQSLDPMQQYNQYGMNQMMQPMMQPNYVPPGFLPPLIPNVSRPLPDIVDLRSLRSAIAIIREDSEAQAVLARDAARNAQQLAEQGQKLQQVYIKLLKEDRLKSASLARHQRARNQRTKPIDNNTPASNDAPQSG